MPVDVFAGEDDSVQFDEGLRVDARTRVAPVDCEIPAWLTGKPTCDLASGDRHIVFRQQFPVALDPGLSEILITRITDCSREGNVKSP